MDFLNITSKLSPNGFNERCLPQLPLEAAFNGTRGLLDPIDKNGNLMDTFTNDTWGISIGDCYRYCSIDKVPYVFSFQLFASSFPNFLLPWLALTAQLPYETGGPWNNLLALCLAVGSPVLITYSLTLTILNRYSLRTRWRSLHQTVTSGAGHDKYGYLSERVKAIQFLLQEAQQVPLRASQEKGWLSSLVVGPKNRVWWKNLGNRLVRTRRGVTSSLVAQTLAAGIAWLLTVASWFINYRGSRLVSDQLSSGTLWIWLIPVIMGWITVGTQNAAGTVNEALRADNAYRATGHPINAGTSATEKGEQCGIVVESGLAVQSHHGRTTEAPRETPPLHNLELPRWCGANIIGDEQQEGPIFNYARVFTWWKFTQTMENALTTTVNRVANGRTCRSSQEMTAVRRWSTEQLEENLAGDEHTTAQYCGLDPRESQIWAYPEWTEIDADVWARIGVASGVSLFLQIGLTGSGVLIAYYTPTKGIGCQTASFLAWGVLAVLAWILLVASMMLSHAVMLRFQSVHKQAPSMDSGRDSAASEHPASYGRTITHSTLCGLAVITRLLGKTIAILNAMWLVILSLMEYIGITDRCYCRGNAIGLGDRGWLVMFVAEEVLAKEATSPWTGGVVTSILICVGIYLFFWLGSRNSARENELQS